jgi:hypothetical protein
LSAALPEIPSKTAAGKSFSWMMPKSFIGFTGSRLAAAKQLKMEYLVR